ncbi:hypothetical protein SLEP1_g36330 [Rubroshorea leprosula]|uniref:HNH homing endonuclease n=1 Tax=Rubroshorea leprosula TaxID=152421 RepID=A0AAV5KRI6_9ROSI|nr:hypothetical protein SLEP1_g36330 [Rubroshorea leprosula]
MVKPQHRSLSQKWERVVHPKFPKAHNPRTLRQRLQRKRVKERCRQQMENSGGMANLAQSLPTRMKSVWDPKDKVFQAKREPESADYQQANQDEKGIIEIPAKEDENEISIDKIIFEKPEKRMAKHIRPLYIHAHMDGMPINQSSGGQWCCYQHFANLYVTQNWQIFERSDGDRSDNQRLHKWSKLLKRNFASRAYYGKLNSHNDGKIEVVKVDDKPFMPNTNSVEAHYYDEEIGTIRFFRMDRNGRPVGITTSTRSTLTKCIVKKVYDELLQPTTIVPFRSREELEIEEIP